MKSYFYKNIYKGLISVLCFVMATPLFSANFGEHRRVIIPQNVNAVYKDLLVLDTMALGTARGRTFLMELGKRPSYFWYTDYMYHLFQNQTLNINNIKTLTTDANSQTFQIGSINLDRGSFLSERLSLPYTGDSENAATIVGNPNVILQNASNLLLVFPGTLNAYINSYPTVNTYNMYSKSVSFMNASGTGIEGARYLRDVQVQHTSGNNTYTVQFVSPRMVIYNSGSNYYAQGTALEFTTPSLERSYAPEGYYGPWEVWGPVSQHGLLINSNSSSNDTICGTRTSQCSGDTDTEEYHCVSNSTGTCYDYQVKVISYTYGGNDVKYNSNGASYKFKVEEVYQLDSSGHVELVSQTPRTRVTATENGEEIQPISYMNNGVWELYPVNGEPTDQYFYVDGGRVQMSNISYGSADNDPVCFTICDGKLCDEDRVHIALLSDRGLEGGTSSPASNWPEQEGAKQNLRILTYTVTFCPNRSSNTYSQYEKNYINTDDQKFIDGLLIKSGNNWVTPKVCMRRQVKCHPSGIENKFFKRQYKPLSTDN